MKLHSNFSTSRKYHNLRKPSSLLPPPQLSHIPDGDLLVSKLPVAFNSLLQQELNIKLSLDPIYGETSGILETPINFDQLPTQDEVCLIPGSSYMLTEYTKSPPINERRSSISEWLDSVDRDPYIPPECSTAVSFFESLQCFSSSYQRQQTQNGVVGMDCDTDYPMLTPDGALGTCTTVSPLPNTDSPQTRSSMYTQSSTKSCTTLYNNDNNECNNRAEEIKAIVPSMPHSKTSKSIDTTGIWNSLDKEESESASEIDDIWFETPVFALCFLYTQGRRYFVGAE